MPYSKHTNMELLAVVGRCVSDLLKALAAKAHQPRAEALRDEIGKRIKDASAQEVKEPEMRVCEFCGVKHLKVEKPKTWPTFTGHTHGE